MDDGEWDGGWEGGREREREGEREGGRDERTKGWMGKCMNTVRTNV